MAADFPTFVLVVLTAAWLLRQRGLPRWTLVLALLSAVGGVACESVLSRVGGFYYVQPDFLGVPRWPPALYLHAALAAARIRPLL